MCTNFPLNNFKIKIDIKECIGSKYIKVFQINNYIFTGHSITWYDIY